MLPRSSRRPASRDTETPNSTTASYSYDYSTYSSLDRDSRSDADGSYSSDSSGSYTGTRTGTGTVTSAATGTATGTGTVTGTGTGTVTGTGTGTVTSAVTGTATGTGTRTSTDPGGCIVNTALPLDEAHRVPKEDVLHLQPQQALPLQLPPRVPIAVQRPLAQKTELLPTQLSATLTQHDRKPQRRPTSSGSVSVSSNNDSYSYSYSYSGDAQDSDSKKSTSTATGGRKPIQMFKEEPTLSLPDQTPVVVSPHVNTVGTLPTPAVPKQESNDSDDYSSDVQESYDYSYSEGSSYTGSYTGTDKETATQKLDNGCASQIQSAIRPLEVTIASPRPVAARGKSIPPSLTVHASGSVGGGLRRDRRTRSQSYSTASTGESTKSQSSSSVRPSDHIEEYETATTSDYSESLDLAPTHTNKPSDRPQRRLSPSYTSYSYTRTATTTTPFSKTITGTKTSSYSCSENFTMTPSSSASYSRSATVEDEGISSSDRSVESPPVRMREVIMLTTPAEKAPRLRPFPQSCVVYRSSINDTVSTLLDRLSEIQTHLLETKAREQAEESIANKKLSGRHRPKGKRESGELVRAVRRPTVEEIPSRHFVKRTLKFALKAVGVQRADKRDEILKSVPMPLFRDAAQNMLNYYAHESLVSHITSMFSSYDRFRSGEVPLDVALELLSMCGITRHTAGGVEMFLRPQTAKHSMPLLHVTQRERVDASPVQHDDEGEGVVPQPDDGKCDVVVDVCKASGRVGGDSAYWVEATGDVYLGQHVVAKAIVNRRTACQVVAYIEALAYVCTTIALFLVETEFQYHVLYVPLLKALLPPKLHIAEEAHSLIYEKALTATFKPLQRVELLATSDYLQEQSLLDGEEVVLGDTRLPHGPTADPEQIIHQLQKHMDIKLKPYTAAGVQSKVDVDDAHTTNSICLEVGLSKMYIEIPVPAEAHCYCLLSARSMPAGEWMTAAVVSVRSITPSKKGGFKWKFNDGTDHRVFVSGTVEDTLYIEACYDVQDESGELTTWCVGHAVVLCGSAKKGKLPIRHGSLFSDLQRLSVIKKVSKGSKGAFCMPWRRRTDGPLAKVLYIIVKRLPPKALAELKSLPPQFLVLRRHANLMARLRRVVTECEGSQFNQLQILRQQQVRCCFLVAADISLMDALNFLWERTLRGKLGPKPKTPWDECVAMLSLTSKIVAVHNSTACDKRVIIDVVTRAMKVPIAGVKEAPLHPVSI
ncbi:hypothetical protein ERJ75_000241600 [Trypanosoma vivax]|nr:hypothetical protein ERJ75_000241600 [Trypanosoma vivax]